MGCFNYVCCVSGLPIEGGTPVRFLALTQTEWYRPNEHICYVTGRWQPRAAALRAVYSDYGSVADIQEGLAERVLWGSFAKDVVEVGVGDDDYRDVSVRREMSREEWLEALWQGRVYVQSGERWSHRLEPPAGQPTLQRVESALVEAGLQLSEGPRKPGYLVNETAPGFVRIRAATKDAELKAALEAVQAAGYATMIHGGAGYSDYRPALLVASSPDAEMLRPVDWAPKRRAVCQVMIREDVWQILLSTPLETWDGTYSIADMRRMAREAVAHERQVRSEYGDKLWRLGMMVDDENIFHTSLLHPGDEISGFYLREALLLAEELSGGEGVLGYAEELAELLHVQIIYGQLGGQWRPITNCSQEGHWEERRAFLRALLEIRGQWEDEELVDTT